MRFLIDECLHKGLVKIAHAAGYEAHHVVELGKGGRKDHELFKFILKEEFVLVTNNGRDFRRLIEKTELHPGLVVIVPNVKPPVEDELLSAALVKIAQLSGTVNKVIEVWSAQDVRVYELPGLK